MRKATPYIGAILLLELSGANAWAMQRHHKPWLMFGHREKPAEAAPAELPRKILKAEPPKPVLRAVSKRGPSGAESEEPSTPKTGQKIAKQAMHYKGTRYKFGGTSKKGMDCSGLVARVYEDLKIKRIPRASSELYKSGTPVRLSELRPGDLVFFKNTYRRGISHVGVYAGHNKFVHAANHHSGVTLTAMSDPYYQLHYAGARRLY